MSDIKEFVYQTARPLPVILLLDTSGSMSTNNKIGIMNQAIKAMLADFIKYSNTIADINVAIITFGNNVSNYLPLQSVRNIDISEIKDMSADGMTPLGEALKLAKDLVENRESIPSRAYRPTVVLVSDGQPNDEWETPLREFINDGRSAKCYRMAMSIGVEPGTKAYEMLQHFVSDEESVFEAQDASEISKFFQYVTMSTSSRVSSKNPNIVPNKEEVFAISDFDFDSEDDDFDF